MLTNPKANLVWWRVASIALGIVTAGVAIVVMVNDEEARSAIELLALPALALTVVFGVANIGADSFRFHSVLPDSFRSRIGLWHWHRLYATGRLLNQLIPQAGGAYRAAQLRLDYGVPIAMFYGAVAATTGVGAAVAWVAAGLIVISGSPLVGSVLLAFGVGSLLAFAILARRMGRAAGSPAPVGRLRRLARTFAAGFIDLAHRHRFTRALAVALFGQLCGVLAYVVICDALGVADPLVVGAALYAGTSVATIVSLTPGGLGLTELAAGLAGHFVAVGAGVGVLVALVARVTGLVAALTIAGVSVLVEKRPVRPRPESTDQRDGIPYADA